MAKSGKKKKKSVVTAVAAEGGASGASAATEDEQVIEQEADASSEDGEQKGEAVSSDVPSDTSDALVERTPDADGSVVAETTPVSEGEQKGEAVSSDVPSDVPDVLVERTPDADDPVVAETTPASSGTERGHKGGVNVDDTPVEEVGSSDERGGAKVNGDRALRVHQHQQQQLQQQQQSLRQQLPPADPGGATGHAAALAWMAGSAVTSAFSWGASTVMSAAQRAAVSAAGVKYLSQPRDARLVGVDLMDYYTAPAGDQGFQVSFVGCNMSRTYFSSPVSLFTSVDGSDTPEPRVVTGMRRCDVSRASFLRVTVDGEYGDKARSIVSSLTYDGDVQNKNTAVDQAFFTLRDVNTYFDQMREGGQKLDWSFLFRLIVDGEFYATQRDGSNATDISAFTEHAKALVGEAVRHYHRDVGLIQESAERSGSWQDLRAFVGRYLPRVADQWRRDAVDEKTETMQL